MMTRAILLAALAYSGFVSLGLPDGILGVAWPSVRAFFGVPLDALGGLLVAFTAGYLVSSFSGGAILARIPLGSLLALSCLATAASLLGYAVAQRWAAMVVLSAVAGLGAEAIDAGLNAFAAVHFSARMTNWLHACYGVGAAVGPVLMTGIIMSGQPWQRGYVIIGLGQLGLALCFTFTRWYWPASTMGGSDAKEGPAIRETLRAPAAWFSTALFFVYTGIEAAAGAWSFSLFTESRGVAAATAGTWVSVYWGCLTVGRLLAGIVAGFIAPGVLLRISMSGLVGAAALLWLDRGANLSFTALALLGLFAAPVFPTLIATTAGRLGDDYTSNGVGLQIAAAVLGQSLLPAMIGVVAARLGLEVLGPALTCSAVLLLILYHAAARPSRGGGRWLLADEGDGDLAVARAVVEVAQDGLLPGADGNRAVPISPITSCIQQASRRTFARLPAVGRCDKKISRTRREPGRLLE